VPRRLDRIPVVLLLGGLLSGCYGAKLVREPLNAHDTLLEVQGMRKDMGRLQARVDSLDAVTREQASGQSSLRATFQIQMEQILDQLRSLQIQTQELMDLTARGMSGESTGRVPSRPYTPPDEPAPAAAGAAHPSDLPPVEDAGFDSSPPPRDAVAVPPVTETATSAAGLEARQLYDSAYLDLTRGNYQLALMEFRDFLRRFPDTDLADNAQYWVGEAYYTQGQYAQSIEEFLKVVNEYPDTDKVAAAYLKTAYSFRGLGDLPTARRYLRYLMDRYPDAEEAQLAREALSDLR